MYQPFNTVMISDRSSQQLHLDRKGTFASRPNVVVEVCRQFMFAVNQCVHVPDKGIILGAAIVL